MTDLSKYRLNSLTEIDEIVTRIGIDKFYNYKQSVFAIIYGLPEGGYYDITSNVRRENYGVFIKLVCLYIMLTGENCNVVLLDDYTKVKGIQSFNAGQEEMAEYQKQVKRMRNEKV
jgi:hypothetical protein